MRTPSRTILTEGCCGTTPSVSTLLIFVVAFHGTFPRSSPRSELIESDAPLQRPSDATDHWPIVIAWMIARPLAYSGNGRLEEFSDVVFRSHVPLVYVHLVLAENLVLRFWRFRCIAIQKRIHCEPNSLRNLFAKRNFRLNLVRHPFLSLKPCDL